jgi:hypothetical protein
MGGIAALRSRAACGVLLYLSVILRRHLFWVTSRRQSVVLAISSQLDCTPHTGAADSIIGLTVVLDSRHECLIYGPHVDAAIPERAVKAVSTFLVARFDMFLPLEFRIDPDT